MKGPAASGAYIPYSRLDRKAIAAALGQPAGKGTRAVASYDEDTTSMGVEAARAALRGAPALRPAGLYFAPAAPGYLDKTNATAIHAALDLDPATAAFDMLGSVRSGAGALRAVVDAARPTLAVLSDIRTGLPRGAAGRTLGVPPALRRGLPGGADEREGGDAAVAFLCAEDSAEAPVLAEPIAWAHTTAEFLDRWRQPAGAGVRQG